MDKQLFSPWYIREPTKAIKSTRVSEKVLKQNPFRKLMPSFKGAKLSEGDLLEN